MMSLDDPLRYRQSSSGGGAYQLTRARCGDKHWGTDGELHFCDRAPGHRRHGEMHHADGLLWSNGRKAPYRRPSRWHKFRQWLARKVDPGEWDGEPR